MAKVEAIYICEKAAMPTQSVPQVKAIPGLGLEGDRYHTHQGKRAHKDRTPQQQLTLIEAEAIESFNAEFQADLSFGDARRNIVTRGISLNDYVGKELTIGEVVVQCMELCEPCKYLQDLINEPVLEGLLHRGGLRVQILNEGEIKVGDTISEMVL